MGRANEKRTSPRSGRRCGSQPALENQPAGNAPLANTAAPAKDAGPQQPAARSGQPAFEVPGLGRPTFYKEMELPIQQWIKDGGGREVIQAPAGQVFLVARFHNAPERPIQYTASDYWFQVEGGAETIHPYGVTTGTANPADAAAGPLRFQLEVAMTECTPKEGAFAVVFLVPEGSRRGTLTVKDAQIPAVW